MLHLFLSASLLSTPAPCDHFFGGATTADIGHPVCGRDEASKLDPSGRVLVCRPAKLPAKLRGTAITDAETLESELNLVGEPACPGAPTVSRRAPALSQKAPALAKRPPSLASRS